MLFIVLRNYLRIDGVEHIIKFVAERLVGRGRDVIVLTGDNSTDELREKMIYQIHLMY